MTLHIRIENANRGNNKSAVVVTKDSNVETSRQTVKEGEAISVYATDSRSFEITEVDEVQPERKASEEPIRQFFEHAHLPGNLAAVSRPFAELADKVLADLPRNAERTVALRKMLEAKDAAVRALLAK